MPHFDHLPREESETETETETESSSSVGVVRTKTKPSKPKRDILAWTENVTKESLDDFLSAHQPSKTKNSADGWIWVRSARNPHANLSREEKEFFGEAVGQAMQVAEDVMKKAEEIKNDPNVPVRTSKKGPGRRDQLNKQGDILLAELKKIGTSSPALATGKWMWFEPAEKVDTLFSVLARSLIDGPLARLGYNEPEGPVVHTLKVATADSAKSDDRKDQQFLICLYFDSIWEKKHAKEVLHSLAAEHGVHHPSAAKADLYTYVNLTSNHPTKARSSNWRPTELILTDVYDDLKEAFWQMKKSGDWDRAEKEDREQFRKIVGGRGSLGVGEAGGGPGLAAGVGEKVKGKGKGKKDDGDERTGTESKPNSPPTKVDRHPSATAGVGDLQATASGSSTKIMPPPRTKVIKPTIVAGKPIAFAQDSDSEEDDEAEAERARERARRDGQTLHVKVQPASSSASSATKQSEISVTSSAAEDETLYTIALQHPAPEFASPTEEPDDNSLHARSLRAPQILRLGPADSLSENATETEVWNIQYVIFTLWPEQELVVLTPRAIEDAGLDGLRRRILTSGMAVEQPAAKSDSDAVSKSSGALLLLRSSFWAGAGQGALEGTAFAPWILPRPLQSALTRTHTPSIIPHLTPPRSPLPKPTYKVEGPLYVRYIPHLKQTLSFRLVDPEDGKDVENFAKWQDSDRVHAGWRQRSPTLDEHRAYLRSTHESSSSLGLIGYWDEEPWGYVEVYWVKESNIAPFFGVREFDRGFHALVGEEKFRGEHRVRAWMSSVLHMIFLLDPRTDRAVSEPRASNAKMVNYECLNGGHVEKFIDLGHKRAALVLFPRERFFQLCPMAWTPQPSASSQK
ncbi:unnamed protein product [Tilletia controversa]|nr:unnamed protein product [Tilletia controversa]